ncbi:MAG: AMP-dependent synthetase/ligase [Nannocystaceae bacterium]|nr:AMP-dependent synthetase/ligase [bacterium]
MDVSAHLEIKPAPAILFERAATRRARPRYMLPTADGGWKPRTWGEHADAARHVAAALVQRGLASTERVAIFSGNCTAWIESALGAQAAGLVVVPVYPASTAEQAGYVLEHSDARALFVSGEALVRRTLRAWQSLESVGTIVVLDDTSVSAVLDGMGDDGERVPTAAWVERRFVHLSTLIDQGKAALAEKPDLVDERLAAIALEDPALMLYTSGTTGRPKGVPLTHQNIGVNAHDWIVNNGPAIPDDAIDVLWLPMSHIFGFGEACLGNNLGFTSYLCSPKEVMDVVPKVRPTVFMSVPAYWEKLAGSSIDIDDDDAAKRQFDEVTGGRLRFCLSGGAGLSIPVKEHYARCGVVIIEGYGLTECSPTLTLNRPGDYRFDSVGKPLPSVELKLAEDGEILARGPSVFGGYHKDPTATAAAFDDEGWFKTGDIGRWTDDGFLQIVDRKKEILVTAGGKNVPPANIERLFASDPLFAHVVVYGDGRKYLVAGVWLDEQVLAERLEAAGAASDDAAAREAMVQAAVDAANAQLARFEQIKRFRIMERPLTVEDGLLTSTLKVRRKHIYKAFGTAFEGLYT